MTSVVSIFKIIWGTVATKNYYLATLFLVINKFFEKLVNSKLVNNRNGFRSSHSTAHLLTVLSERSLRAFYRSGSTQAVALDTSNDFDRVFPLVFFMNSSLFQIQVGCLPLFGVLSVIDGSKRFLEE